MASNREQELLAALFRHIEAEEAKDVEKSLATCTPDIVYEHPFRPEELVTDGVAAVRARYERIFPRVGVEKRRIVRTWVSGDDTLIYEFDNHLRREGGSLVRNPGLAIFTFRDGLVAREIVYNGPEWPVS
jgi:ketosteroid isomerase-like protein